MSHLWNQRHLNHASSLSLCRKKNQVIWLVWNKSTCHLRGCPDAGDSANRFSCADLRGELIHVQNAAGCSAGAVSPSHRPAAALPAPPTPPFTCMHVVMLTWKMMCLHSCELHSIWFRSILVYPIACCRRNWFAHKIASWLHPMLHQ